MTRAIPLLLAAACAFVPPADAQVRQTQEDDYTRYELLGPDTAQFRILYDVTATTPNAPFFFNTIRKGSIATDERVIDPATGKELKWEVVGGAQARKEGHPGADLDTEYIKVYLARPVPANGQARVLIDKTYKDPKSYFRQGDLIVFDRPLGIRRNAIVLPAGYRLVSLNVPSQILTEPDGRVMVSFMHPGPNAAPLVITAKEGLGRAAADRRSTRGSGYGGRHATDQRANDNREREYRLEDPASHRLVRVDDLTAATPGATGTSTDVLDSTTVVDVSAVNLDTGEALGVEKSRQGLMARLPSAAAGASTRVRVTSTLVDDTQYGLDGEELVLTDTTDVPRIAVTLPEGWTVTESAAPVVVSEVGGRQRLEFENTRPGSMGLLIRARRIAASR